MQVSPYLGGKRQGHKKGMKRAKLIGLLALANMRKQFAWKLAPNRAGYQWVFTVGYLRIVSVIIEVE